MDLPDYSIPENYVLVLPDSSCDQGDKMKISDTEETHTGIILKLGSGLKNYSPFPFKEGQWIQFQIGSGHLIYPERKRFESLKAENNVLYKLFHKDAILFGHPLKSDK